MGIASLGALANGLTRGMVQGEQLVDMRDQRADRQERRQRQRTLDERNDVVWGRQQDQFAREDQERATLEEANQAGAEVLKRYESEWKKQQPGPTLDGSPVAVNPFRPTPMQILEAGSARTNTLLKKKGPTEAWLNSWTNDERMRTQLRTQAGQKVKAALAAGADPTEPLSEFFGTISDGYQVRGVKRTNGADGKPTLVLDRVNAYTGEPADPMVIPADRLIDMLAANPADVAKHSLNMTLKAYEAMLQRGTNEQKHKLSLEEIEARGGQERTTAREKERLERNRPYNLGEGGERFVDELQPDGTLKPKRIAANPKDPSGSRVTTASQLNAMVINNYGVLDVGTGKQTGSAKTQALAAAAERLLTDNPGLGANEAIAQAAKDMGLQLVPKK